MSRNDKKYYKVEEKVTSRFVFQTGKGYNFEVIDFGNAGLKFIVTREKAPEWDREACIMVTSRQVDEFLRWAGGTMGRPAMALPKNTLSAIRRVLNSNKVSIWSRNILIKAANILESLQTQKSYNVRSRAQRALNR